MTKHGAMRWIRIQQLIGGAGLLIMGYLRVRVVGAIVATLLFSTIAEAASDRVALVVGNSNYRTATKLSNPRNDATDVSAVLKRMGFDVVDGFDLDKRAMEEKVIEFSRKLDDAKIALFFYAGHGLQVDGKNYLLPVDARLERAGDLSFETIGVNQVLAQMEAVKRVNLVFLDSCRDNPLTRSFARTATTRTLTVGQGLASVQGAIGTMIAYATQPDNVAFDGDGRNSPFTAALLKHIETPGLEVRSMMTRVRADVLAKTNDMQVPWDHSSLVGDVVLAALPLTAPQVVPTPAPASVTPVTAPSADEIAWEFVKDSGSAEQLRRFLRQYPDSRRRLEAEQKLQQLTPAAPVAAIDSQSKPDNTPSKIDGPPPGGAKSANPVAAPAAKQIKPSPQRPVPKAAAIRSDRPTRPTGGGSCFTFNGRQVCE